MSSVAVLFNGEWLNARVDRSVATGTWVTFDDDGSRSLIPMSEVDDRIVQGKWKGGKRRRGDPPGGSSGDGNDDDGAAPAATAATAAASVANDADNDDDADDAQAAIAGAGRARNDDPQVVAHIHDIESRVGGGRGMKRGGAFGRQVAEKPLKWSAKAIADDRIPIFGITKIPSTEPRQPPPVVGEDQQPAIATSDQQEASGQPASLLADDADGE